MVRPPSQRLHILAAAALTLLPALPALLSGCVSSARHDAVVVERNRLRRENERLQREAVEHRVRAEEALEALRAERGERPAPAAAPSAPPPREASDPLPEARPAPAHPQGRDRQAILEEDLRDAPPPNPAPSRGEEGILRVARRYTEIGRIQQAIDAYTRLMTDYPFSPHLPEAFLARGRLRQARGDDRGALADFDTVAEAFPKSPQAPEARRLSARLRDR